MYTTHNKKGEPIIKLNKSETHMIVFECLDCSAKMFIQNGIDGYKCYKCGGVIDPIGTAERTD
jgi:hypothetical protein